MPCPDSSTYTSKLFASPRKAIPVGAFNPATKTDAVNPGGRTMLGDNPGLKNAVLSAHWGEGVGFATTAAWAAVAIASDDAVTSMAVVAFRGSNFISGFPPH